MVSRIALETQSSLGTQAHEISLVFPDVKVTAQESQLCFMTGQQWVKKALT